MRVIHDMWLNMCGGRSNMKAMSLKFKRYFKLSNYLNAALNFFRIVMSWSFFFLRKPTGLKYFAPWFFSLHPHQSALRDEQPWIEYEVCEFLESFLKNDMTVFEWGCGGSTLFIAQRVKKIISVEHDGRWYERVRQDLTTKKIDNCNLILHQQEENERGVSDARQYKSSAHEYTGMNFKKYCRTIEMYPDNFFDLVFIDGRARNACVCLALKKIKTEGLLILDDSERSDYQKTLDEVSVSGYLRKDFFGPVPYITMFAQTTIFQKVS